MKRRYICKNKSAVATVIETTIALAIILTILALFYSSINNLLIIHVRSETDLEAKCLDITEIIISSPGLNDTFHLNWEDGSSNASRIGLGATKTIAYGTFQNLNNYDDPELCTFTSDTFGSVVSSCFLSETKVVMENSQYKNIEDIIIGDNVLSYDTSSGKIIHCNVVDVFQHKASEMTEYYLIINDFLKVTPNHLLYLNDRWTCFDDVSVGDIINNVLICSVEKVFEKVPTYNLEIEGSHNYFVCFNDNPLLVHNPTNFEIPWNPWVITSKDPKVTYHFETNANRYYTEYTFIDPTDTSQGGIYEIKAESNYLYPTLDSSKIEQLTSSDYDQLKEALGLKGDEYSIYDFSINIHSKNYSQTNEFNYGAEYQFANSVVSVTRNVLIYHPPTYDYANPTVYTDFIPPYYEGGRITVKLFKGGYT